MSVIGDPQGVARHVVDLMASLAPGLKGVTAVVQFSSSAGICELADAEEAEGLAPRWRGVAKAGNRIGAHVLFWLTHPLDDPSLDRWAKQINAAAGHKAIDPATFRTVRPHYTADPVFERGLHDPLAGKRIVLVPGLRQAATLIIPALPDRAPSPMSRPLRPEVSETLPPHACERLLASTSFAHGLGAIGHPEQGFHQPINAAIRAYVRRHWPDVDQDALIDTLVDRISRADPVCRAIVTSGHG